MTDIASRDRIASFRLFAGLCIAFSLSVLLPILLAARPCNDDLARSVLGSYGWTENGRYLANLLMRALELGASRASDIAPIPQFLGIVALSYAGVLLARRFDIVALPLGILVTLPLGTQPFFLQNLSYRFDAVTMAAAVLCSVCAVAISACGRRNWFLGILTLLASFNLYQPAFNVFLVLSSFEIAFEIAQENPKREVVRLAAFRFSQAIVAAIAYKVLFTTNIKDWVAAHGETIHSLDTLPGAGTNALAFLRYVRDALGERLTVIFLVITLIAALPMIVLGMRRLWREQSMRSAALQSVFLLTWPVLGLFSSFGILLLLIDPVFAPRALTAFGALISASLISAAHVAQRIPRLRVIPYVSGFVCFLVSAITAGAYASAAAEQAKFEDHIAATMQDDLAQLKSNSALVNYVLIGSPGYAPAVQHAVSQFPIISPLLESYLTQDSFFTKAYLLHFRQPLTLIESTKLPEAKLHAVIACASPTILTRSAYSVRLIDDLAIVDFRATTSCGTR